MSHNDIDRENEASSLTQLTGVDEKYKVSINERNEMLTAMSNMTKAQAELRSLLGEIKKQIMITNMHLVKMTDLQIDEGDL